MNLLCINTIYCYPLNWARNEMHDTTCVFQSSLFSLATVEGLHEKKEKHDEMDDKNAASLKKNLALPDSCCIDIARCFHFLLQHHHQVMPVKCHLMVLNKEVTVAWIDDAVNTLRISGNCFQFFIIRLNYFTHYRFTREFVLEH